MLTKTNIKEKTVNLFSRLRSERIDLGLTTKDYVTAIIGNESLAQIVFEAARGPYLVAKDTDKKEAIGISSDWKRFNDACRHHFTNAGYVMTWPNFRSGEGEYALKLKKDDNADKKAKKAAQDEKDAIQRQKHIQETLDQQLSEWRALGPDSVAAELLTKLHAWSDDSKAKLAVLESMVEKMALSVLVDDARAAQKPAKPAKPAAKPAKPAKPAAKPAKPVETA